MADRRPSLSVCIVTHEFAGLPGSGGIGTAFAGLARTLADTGHAVTVLCSGLLPVPDELAAPGIAVGPGIAVVRLPDAPLRVEGDRFLRLSHDVFQWLAGRRFDVVHFADWTGLGFCATAAKRQGLAFVGTTLVVGLHGPTRWVRSASGGGLDGPDELAVDFLERRSIEWADVAVAPSGYLIDWLRASGVTLPDRTELRQNILPCSIGASPNPGTEVRAVTELVFFGRLETRKGVALFCDALDRLAADATEEAVEGGLCVTFLGNPAPVDGEDGAVYARRRAAAWPWPVTFRHGLSSADALDCLTGAGRLAVIPSLIENSPCTVAECLIRGLPFLASRVGGTAELVAGEDVERVLFEPAPDALAVRLREVLRHGARPARLRVPQEEVAADWLAWHAAEAPRRAPAADGKPVDEGPAAGGPDSGYRLLTPPGLRLLDGAAERMAAVAARTGAAIVTGAVDEEAGTEAAGRRRWLAAGGPAALAPWAVSWNGVAGPGPLLVRADLADENPTRLLLAGHRVAVMPVPVATTDIPPATRPAAVRQAPLLETEAGETVGDLARLVLGMDVRTAQSVAAAARLTAERDAAQAELKELRAERNRLAAALEGSTADDESGRRAVRLTGLLDSRSWGLTEPLRRRLGAADAAVLAALPADRAIEAVLASAWWDLTAPLRIATRLAMRLIRRR